MKQWLEKCLEKWQKLQQKWEDSGYTTTQQRIAVLFVLAIAIGYGVAYGVLGWTWPPVCVSIAKAVGALTAALTALISVVKEDIQDKLDALKDKTQAASDDSAKYSNSIKTCRIWQLCLLTLAFAAAAIAI